ncbi:MAG TPA: hypothetical protein VH183_02290 [Burkholderiaceae bacterium]|nr:hypothetical protein [Burkholderiaceae bacterium]
MRAKRLCAAVALALAAVAFSQRANACASCGCTLSKDWLGPQAGSISGWSVGVSYDFIDQNQMRAGRTNIDQATAETILNPPGHTGNEVELQTLSRTTTFSVDYNTSDWGISIQAPFVNRYHTTLQDGTDAGYNFNQFNALGDVRVIGKYLVSESPAMGVIAGLKLPTSVTDEPFNGPNGGVVDPSLQPGTGSTDVLLGGFYSGQADKLGWFAQGLWQHAVASQAGYTPGDAITVNAGLRYANMGQAVVPLFQVNYVHRNIDRGNLVNVEFDGSPLSGGDLLYLAPGVSARLGAGFSAYGYVQFPVYQDVNGVQLTPKQIYSVGLRKTF